MGLNMVMNGFKILRTRDLRYAWIMAIWVICVPASLAAEPLTPILLEGSGAIAVTSADVFIDQTAALDIKEVRESDFDSRWERHEGGTLNLGYTNSAVWLKFKVQGSRVYLEPWLLELAYANLDHIDVWLYSGERLLSTYETGDSLPFLTRPVEHRHFLVPIPDNDGQALTVVLRVASTTSLQIPLALWPRDDFYRTDQKLQLIQGMFFGIMLVMAIYNFFIYLVIRERAYLFYVLFVVMEGSYQGFHQGFTYQNLWPESTWWHSVSGGIAISLTIAFAAFCSTEMLELRRIKSRWVRFFDTVGAIGVGVAACSLILDHSWTARAASLLAIVAAVGIMCSGIQRWRDGFRPAKTFTMAWGAFLFGGITFALSKLGLLGHNVVTEYSFQIGATLEVMLLSFALGQRINDEKRDKFMTKARLLDEQVRLREAYERFVPRRFLALLGKGSITEVKLGDHVAMNLTILFADIREFTSLSEKMTSKENFSFLNNYLKRMEPVVDSHGGFVDKYIGDCIMALFDRRPDDAIEACIVMMQKLAELNEELREEGKEPFEIGIGVNWGEMMLGTVGATGRMEGTVISDAVNTASRVESLTKIYGTPLLITEAVFDRLVNPSRFALRILDRVRVKGRQEPVVLYEVLDVLSRDVRRLRMSYQKDYETAIRAFWAAKFDEALECLRRCAEVDPEDRAVQLFLRRCQWHRRQKVDTNWTGAFEVAALKEEIDKF